MDNIERPNKITFYRVSKNKPIPGWNVHAASPKRDWMEIHTHMYRCLPITIANQNGWVIECPCDISAIWFGGLDPKTSMHFWVDKEYNIPKPWVKCHFLGGIITFEFDFIIKTTEKTNLLVRGAPNFFIDGLHPLEGLVETDWLSFSFTMNWKVTQPNKLVTFKKGDPICFIQPVPHNYSETFNKTSNFLKYQFQGNHNISKIIEKTSIRWVTIDTLLNCIDNTQEACPLSLRGVFKKTIENCREQIICLNKI